MRSSCLAFLASLTVTYAFSNFGKSSTRFTPSSDVTISRVISVKHSVCSGSIILWKHQHRHVRFSLSVARKNNIRTSNESVEILSKLTVLQLKDKLKQLSLSTDGRKDDLIDRLMGYHTNTKVDHTEVKDNASDYTQDETFNENFTAWTIPILKGRLKELGLPMGGRKAELIERLQSANVNEKRDLFMVADDFQTSKVDRDGSNLTKSTSLVDSPDKIREYEEDEDEDDDDDDDEDSDDENNSSYGYSNTKTFVHIDDDSEWSSEESASARRARRKKFWKAQEVRALIKANVSSAVAKAEDMISTLEDMAKRENDDNYLPGPIEYTLLIDAYAKSGGVDATQRAESVIDRLLHANTGSEVSPNAQMMNAVMSTYANIGNVDAATKATAILERMEYLAEFGQLVKPTVHSYSIAISAWAKCRSRVAAENAENILNRLFDNYDDAVLRSNSAHYIEELRPNNVVFNSVIDAWARSSSNEAGEKAEALLRRMEALSKTDKYDVRPDTITFNTCIKAWCNSDRPDAPYKAEEILDTLEKNPQYPRRSGGKKSGMFLLISASIITSQTIISDFLTVRPNRLSFNTVINSWAKSQLPESAQRSEALLLRMIKYYKADTYATVFPDAVTFSSVLNTLAKSEVVQYKAKKCSSILNAMLDLHEVDGSIDTRPNSICYNTVLNAAAFSARGSEVEKRQALSVAVDTFNQMKQSKYVTPDAVTYGHMLKAFANLMPPGEQRNTIASKIFTSCCVEGLVGGMCLDEIRRCIPARAFLLLLEECGYDEPLRQDRKPHSVALNELPKEWTRFVATTDMASRQRTTFVKPKKSMKKKTKESSHKRKQSPPVIPRPGILVEYGASGRDL